MKNVFQNKFPLSAYLELTKPRILSLVLVTTAIGFFLGNHGVLLISKLLITLMGAGLVCAGASVLNQYLERDSDSRMERTKRRPLPLGIISANNALIFGILLVLFGVAILAIKINILTAFLSLLTAFLYVLVYTPLKKISWLNTTIGAIPGAIPPMGGWAAASGELDLGAWILFLVLFIWQHPHFYAIAWIFKDDYRRGGFKMLPVIDQGGSRTFEQINFFSWILVPISLFPSLIGMSGKVYLYGALILSLGLLIIGQIFILTKSNEDARRLLKATVFYLPILLFLIVLDCSF